MRKEIIEKKLEIVEREIFALEMALNNATVNLRKQKELRWEILEQLEREASD
jgi:hypothetical protein